MNTTKLTLTAAALSLAAFTTFAQEPEQKGRRPGGGDQGGPRPEGQRGGPGGPGGTGGGRPVNPIIQALDANTDGTIDEAEMKNAAMALKKLDKDNDGKLSAEETRPQFGQGGPGGPGGPGGQGGPGGGAEMLTRLMEGDKNKDGKLQKDELPERMQQVMERADTNADGALDKAELEQMAARFRQGGPGGPGGRPGQTEADSPARRPSRPPTDQ